MKLENHIRTYLIAMIMLLLIMLTGCVKTSSDRRKSDDTVDSALVPDSEFYGATHYIYEGGRVIAKILTDSTWTFEINDSTVAWDLDLFFYDSLGQVSSELTADSGLIRSNRGEYRIYGNLEADFFDSLGNPTSHLVGDSGLIIEQTGILHIYENVVVTSEGERKVETDYLSWNSARDIIKTDAFVKFTRGDGDVITTYGLIADRGLTRVRLLNQVSGTVVQDERKKTESKEH